MREIKFRAWDVKVGAYVIPAHTMNIHTGQISDLPDRFLLEQFTGLHDKNGKEIYEGDVLRHGYGDCRGAIVQVIYQAPSFIMKEKPKHKTWYTFILSPEQNQFEEILGNIHENQELLNAH